MHYLEIRPGEGGDDAAAFAEELADALLRYAERRGSSGKLSGREAQRTLVLELSGKNGLDAVVGTHRIQRVPKGSKQRHSSTVTVALVEGVNASVDVVHADVDIDYYRGTGPGGQHRNKTSTAVRLRHRPSGIIVTRETGRSQKANLADAWTDLAGRLRELAEGVAHSRMNDVRRAQIVADRAARSFTHTAWRNEVVCHESGQRWRMSDFLKGRI